MEIVSITVSAAGTASGVVSVVLSWLPSKSAQNGGSARSSPEAGSQ
jgi:hypothetical protein